MSPSKCSISIACRVQSPLPDAHTHGHRKIVPWRPFDQWSATTALNLVVEPMVCHLLVRATTRVGELRSRPRHVQPRFSPNGAAVQCILLGATSDSPRRYARALTVTDAETAGFTPKRWMAASKASVSSDEAAPQWASARSFVFQRVKPTS